MNVKILITVLGIVFLTACNKDKYTTSPQLKYKEVNTKTLNRNQLLIFTLEVTDAEGDIQDTIWVQKTVKNCSNSNFTEQYKIPNFTGTKNLKGDIRVCYAYGSNLGCPGVGEPACPGRSDSATYKFWIQDKEKHKSDTVTSDLIVIKQ